ncbi:MAG: sulfatase [Acidobacteriota bacterium]
MTRRPSTRSFTRIWVAAALALLLAGCNREAPEPPRWNVILIVVDTWRADHLKLYGYDRSTTPFLDQFAGTGVMFKDARSQAGCTFPSVNSMLTSQQPQLFLQTMKDYGWGIPGYMPTLAEMLKKMGYATGAVSASPIIRLNPGPQNPDGGFGAGFDHFNDSCERKPASCINQGAFELLDKLADDPFFLYLHYFEPHDPFQPPEEHQRVFAADEYDKSWVADGTLLPMYRMLYKEGPVVEFNDNDLAHTLDLYDEEILYFDQQFEQLINRLREDGTLERTMIVLASDHGEEFMDHDHLFHCKDLSYDTVMKTPLFVWVPGLDQRTVVEDLAQNLDIVPTVLDYLQIDAGTKLEGKSLRPLIEQESAIHRYIFGMQRYSRTVTDGRFKLSYNIKTGDVRLYDLARDPGERVNIMTRRPELAEEMTATLLRWIEKVESDVDVAARVESASEVTERLKALGYL